MTPNNKGEIIDQSEEIIENYETNYIDPIQEENIEVEPPIYNDWNKSIIEFYPKRKEDEVIIGSIKVPI
jgi:hypothetical protein